MIYPLLVMEREIILESDELEFRHKVQLNLNLGYSVVHIDMRGVAVKKGAEWRFVAIMERGKVAE